MGAENEELWRQHVKTGEIVAEVGGRLLELLRDEEPFESESEAFEDLQNILDEAECQRFFPEERRESLLTLAAIALKQIDYIDEKEKG